MQPDLKIAIPTAVAPSVLGLEPRRACAALGLAVLCALAGCDETANTRPKFPDRGLYIPLPDFSFPDGGSVFTPDLITPQSHHCAGAEDLFIRNGTASIQGTTVGAANEFSDTITCGGQAPLVGPQRYYRIVLNAERTYQFKLAPQFPAALYLASDCGKNIINVDCASQGVSGDHSGPIAPGETETFFFVPPGTGNYILAVDSLEPAAEGIFELEVQEYSSQPNETCLQAESLAFTGQRLQISGNTLGTANQFKTDITCGLGFALDGPQIYYSVELEQGSWYRFTLAPEFPGALYVVNRASNCFPTNMEVDCSGLTGTVLPNVPRGAEVATAFAPLTSDTYIIAVDSAAPGAAGAFQLTMEAFTPPNNMICGAAAPLEFQGGQASTIGDTRRFVNDLGTLMSCGGSLPLVGAQAYHTLLLKQATYQLVLSPTFNAQLALGTSCLTLPVDCGSAGLTGTLFSAPAGSTRSLLFSAPQAGPYVLAVDSTAGSEGGPYTLQVLEYQPPKNDSCAKPDLIELVTSPAATVGNTGALTNDLAGIDCADLQGPWPGPQAYYRVFLQAGETYTVELEPEPGFDPALYAFPAATPCSPTEVNTACQGSASDTLGVGVKESLTLTPTVSGEVILVVDSWSLSEVGEFSLQISW